MGKKWLLCMMMCCSILLLHTPLFANETARLTEITKHIQSLKQQLKNAGVKKSQIQNALKKAELAESHLMSEINKTHKKLKQQHKQLSKLNNKANQLTAKIDENKAALKNQIHTAYYLSRQPAIKYLLNTNSINEYQRTLIYFKYLTHAQAHIIQNLQSTLNEYQQNKLARERTLHHLLETQHAQLKNKKVLQLAQDTRKQLIKQINQHIKTKKQKLNKLTQDKKRLERTLEALNRKKLQDSLFKHPFPKLKGHLIWPTKGRLQRHFGTQIAKSELTWNGVLIEANPGKSVRAVAAGKVIFAKWLQGYGLLMIIDHGNGYMTLYGRNQSLLKNVGDWVKPNTIIAKVGQTGGFSHSALYFSIRHNAKPLNPEKWCR